MKLLLGCFEQREEIMAEENIWQSEKIKVLEDWNIESSFYFLHKERVKVSAEVAEELVCIVSRERYKDGRGISKKTIYPYVQFWDEQGGFR